VHCKPWGLDGGHEAAGNGIGIRHNGVWDESQANAKVFNVRLARGDAYKMLSGGGGGFGEPAERDPELVAHDVREGYVSRAQAEQSYRVALTDAGQVDADATLALRAGPQALVA
jgi:N-methylhydantoinase B